MLSFPTCVCHSMLSVWSRPSSATWNSIKRWICTTCFSIPLSAGIVLFLALHFYKQHCPIFVQEPSGLEVLWVTYLQWNCWVIVNCHCHLYFGVSKLFHMLVIAVGMWGRFQSVRFMKCHCLVHPPPQHWAWRLVHSGARQACGEWVILLDWTADYLRERDECYTSFWYF